MKKRGRSVEKVDEVVQEASEQNHEPAEFDELFEGLESDWDM